MKRTILFVAIALLATPLLACDGLFSKIRQNRIERIQTRQAQQVPFAASSGSYSLSSGSYATGSSTGTVVIRQQIKVAPMSSVVYESAGCTNCQ
jgi:hypothetical protein